MYSRLWMRPSRCTRVPTSQKRGPARVLSPDDAGKIVASPVEPVDREHQIADLPSHRRSAAVRALQSVPVSSTSLTHTGVSGGDSSRANTLMTSLLPSPLWLLNERTSPAMRMSPARDGLSSGRSSSRRRTLIVSTVPEPRDLQRKRRTVRDGWRGKKPGKKAACRRE